MADNKHETDQANSGTSTRVERVFIPIMIKYIVSETEGHSANSSHIENEDKHYKGFFLLVEGCFHVNVAELVAFIRTCDVS